VNRTSSFASRPRVQQHQQWRLFLRPTSRCSSDSCSLRRLYNVSTWLRNLMNGCMLNLSIVAWFVGYVLPLPSFRSTKQSLGNVYFELHPASRLSLWLPTAYHDIRFHAALLTSLTDTCRYSSASSDTPCRISHSTTTRDGPDSPIVLPLCQQL
jgi:hypothetical protein